jgi:hypothetical protein
MALGPRCMGRGPTRLHKISKAGGDAHYHGPDHKQPLVSGIVRIVQEKECKEHD